MPGLGQVHTNKDKVIKIWLYVWSTSFQRTATN